jgi:hypothetical protein
MVAGGSMKDIVQFVTIFALIKKDLTREIGHIYVFSLPSSLLGKITSTDSSI